MADNPYERLSLGDFGDAAARTDALVQSWLTTLRGLLAGGTIAADADRFAALVLWARFKRTRPELLARLKAAGDLGRLDAFMTQVGSDGRVSGATFDDTKWLLDAEQLAAACDDALAFNFRRDLAERLLISLDDAELARYAADKLKVAWSAVAPAAVERCRIWMEDNPSLFLSAAPLVQAIGMTIRPDLPEEDYDLALTALKFEVLLDAAEDMEADLALSDMEVLPGRAASLLREVWSETTLETVLPWRHPASSNLAAAATTASEVPPPVRVYWQPPADLGLPPIEARLVVPATPLPDEDEVEISFYRSDGGPVSSEDLNPVVLAGTGPSNVDDLGVARFRVGELRARGQPLTLLVGPRQISWRQCP